MDRAIKTNYPDMVIKDYKKRICFFINTAIPAYFKVVWKIYEKKLSKYKVLEGKMDMADKTSIIPVVLGELRLI